jgi:hypothetical protein
MVHIEIMSEDAAVYHPDQILVEVFSRFPFFIPHRGMLKFHDNPGQSLYICAVNFSVSGSVCHFAAL